MKNVLLVFGSIIVIIIVTGLTWYNSSYKGPSYYVRVYGEDTHVNKNIYTVEVRDPLNIPIF